MITIPKLASNGAVLAAIFALIQTACPGAGGDDPVCGNGVQEQGESCDDGNIIDNDGCSSTCALEGFCGNGRCAVDGPKIPLLDPRRHTRKYPKQHQQRRQ